MQLLSRHVICVGRTRRVKELPKADPLAIDADQRSVHSIVRPPMHALVPRTIRSVLSTVVAVLAVSGRSHVAPRAIQSIAIFMVRLPIARQQSM